MRTYKSKGAGSLFASAEKSRTRGTTEGVLRMPATRRYLESLQGPDGRFSKSDARTSALVLDALRVLGCDDERVYDRAKEHFLTLENPDWGFSSKPGTAGESDIESTCYATSALKELGVEKQEAADYVLRLHRGNGSFVRNASRPLNNPVNGGVKYTYFAISTLKSAGREEPDVFKRAKRFILGRRHADGSFGSCGGIFSDGSVENVYYAIGALEKLVGSAGNDAKPGTEKYVLDLQNADGGFSLAMEPAGSSFPEQQMGMGGRLGGAMQEKKGHGKKKKGMRRRGNNDGFYGTRKKKGRSTVENTFYAVSALDILGRLDWKVCDSAKAYIMRLENEDGSFGYSLSEPGPLAEPPRTGTPLSTAYAVLTLGMIEVAKES